MKRLLFLVALVGAFVLSSCDGFSFKSGSSDDSNKNDKEAVQDGKDQDEAEASSASSSKVLQEYRLHMQNAAEAYKDKKIDDWQNEMAEMKKLKRLCSREEKVAISDWEKSDEADPYMKAMIAAAQDADFLSMQSASSAGSNASIAQDAPIAPAAAAPAQPVKTQPAPAAAGHPSRIVVAGDDVCLRSMPDEAHKMTGSNNPHLYTGEIYECFSESSDYYGIYYKGSRYYIPKMYGRPR